MNNSRIVWLDRMKGILILLVVLGHAFGSAQNATPAGGYHDFLRGGFKFIYLFHMPAFFFLAGITFKSFDFKKKFLRLLVPYYAFGVISIGLYQVLMPDAPGAWWHPWASLLYGAIFPNTDGFRCNSVLWFLPCLFTTTAVFAFLPWSIQKQARLKVCALSVLACGSVLFFVLLNQWNCPDLPYGLKNMFKYLPFMIVGYLLSPFLMQEHNGTNRVRSYLLWGALGLYFLLVYIAPFSWDMYRVPWKWSVSVGMGFLGTFGCCAVAQSLNGYWLILLGGASIGIMMTHKWFIIILNRVGFYEVLICTLVAVLGSLASTLLIRRVAPEILGESR